MCVSPRSLFTTSLLLVDVLIYLPYLTTCQPATCPDTCTCQEESPGEASLTCTARDVMKSVPQMSTERAKTVVKMIIKNQPRLTWMGQRSLSRYTNLKHLEIESSGLVYLTDDVFESLPALQFLNLRQNCIQNFPMQIVQHLDVRELYIQGNPLRCSCSNAWVQNTSQIIDAAQVTCIHTATEADGVCHFNTREDKTDHQPGEVTKSGPIQEGQLISAQKLFPCETPCVQIDSDVIEVVEGSDVNVTCRMCNNQTQAEIAWQVTDLQSNWTETLLATGHVLQLRNVSSADNFKLVTCVGNNTDGSSSTRARIVIPTSPTITGLDFSFSSPVLTLTYSIIAWPPPELQWLKEMLSMPNSSFILDTEMILDYGGVFRGSRVITNPIGPNIDSMYTLIATNREGTANRSINVTGPADGTFLPALHLNVPDSLPNSVITSSESSSSKANFLWGTASVFELQISLAVTSGILITVLVTVLSVCLRLKLKRRPHVSSRRTFSSPVVKMKSHSFQEEVPLTSINLVENPYYSRGRCKKHRQMSACIKRVKLETILLLRVIGEGTFGKVYLGSCAHLVNKDEFTVVAVKTLKGKSSDTLRTDLEREAEILAAFEHQNIITFYGICTEEQQTSCRNHSPETTCLRGGEPPAADGTTLTLVHLLQISVQIANGMEYLASQHFVHRDMATRNCLVNSGLVVKIGDFGMSRDVYTTDYYKIGGEAAMLPIRWMPPESIFYKTFTVESDVWSFGVTLWEVFTFGKQPWFEYSNIEVIKHIERCQHLRRPHQCPETVYEIMLGCWRVSPQERLSMKEIYKLLADDLTSNQHEYLDILP